MWCDMLLRTVRRVVASGVTSRRSCSEKKFENPLLRTFRILGDDLRRMGKVKPPEDSSFVYGGIPRHADIVIIGGGAIGSSVAYWLKQKSSEHGFNVLVIEKDPTYSKCSTVLSVGGLRQQFSLPENIQMSLYGAEFLRTLKRRFGKEAEVNFTPHGYLVLASEQGAQQLIDNSKLQRDLGAVNVVLSKEQLKQRFPWLHVEDIEAGCLGLQKEGWFDPWSLLQIIKNQAQNMQVRYLHGSVEDFVFNTKTDITTQGVLVDTHEGSNELVVRLANGQQANIEFAFCVIAAGSESADIAKLARIGSGEGIFTVPLPVERRKRYVYRFDCQGEPPGINTPLTIDPSGAYFRRDGLGSTFICGRSPDEEEEPSTENLEVDHNYFDQVVWPLIANRVPAFNCVKVQSAWSGFYEYNYYDQNGIIGCHPYLTNFFFATGFSGHGIQQAPAVGRAIAELILDGQFKTIDLTRLGFDRLLVDKPMYEIGIY